jgi:hypothetical protein
MKNSEGWDGKMRVEPKAVITNPEALEDSDYSDPEAPPVEEIDADEGKDLAVAHALVSYGMNTGLIGDRSTGGRGCERRGLSSPLP